MMVTIFFKLLIVHMLGDFVLFRSDRLKEKGKNLWRSNQLLIHTAIHFILAWIALWNIYYWPYALAIGLSHYVGDLAYGTMSHRRPQIWFVADQVFHVLIIVVVASLITGITLVDGVMSLNVSWVMIAGFVAVSFPAARCISIFLSQWPPARSSEKLKGMVSAGLWIGILERALIYIFIIAGHWEGIGFLLAAKSIFRFGDLTSSKDIYLTEYIMVGTLLSFSIAVITGLLAIYFSA
ncbi:MAG TPA: DUF3307 domain-containing protein [Cyclobacteriaceae bacterium]|nr:DUF3307 domain-containing protein [Cyclobacteriaceae bacterium]